jgi:hypothetical protein
MPDAKQHKCRVGILYIYGCRGTVGLLHETRLVLVAFPSRRALRGMPSRRLVTVPRLSWPRRHVNMRALPSSSSDLLARFGIHSPNCSGELRGGAYLEVVVMLRVCGSWAGIRAGRISMETVAVLWASFDPRVRRRDCIISQNS